MSLPGSTRFVAGLATGLSGGVLSGLFGLGGGTILLPLLMLMLGLGRHQAQGVTLAAMSFPSGVPALIHFRKRGITVPWALAVLMILGFLPGVWAGALLAGQVPDGCLRWGFIGFLLLLTALTLHPRARPEPGRTAPASAGPDFLWKGCLVGMAGGLCSGLLGIGGGVVMIPMLALWLDLPQLQAQVISLTVMVLPIRLPGVLVYAQGTRVRWLILTGLTAGFTLGTYWGARLATRIPARHLRTAFAGLMLITAAMMIWKA